ncbi:MAG: Fic family protein, partial [Crocinitomicaceae bacterium]|nr:Fic family protein [Crocinitomicaceae bacterium]
LSEEMQDDIHTSVLVKSVICAGALEGECFSEELVEASIKRQKNGIPTLSTEHIEKQIDGYVKNYLTAFNNLNQKIEVSQIHNWQQNMFPHSRSGFFHIVTGTWRLDSMGIIPDFGKCGFKEKTLLKAPKGSCVPKEMDAFLAWFNENQDMDLMLKAGLAHLFIQLIQPYEDGNTRMACLMSDILLARVDQKGSKFFNFSQSLVENKDEYFEMLGLIREGNGDITSWLTWYLETLAQAIKTSEEEVILMQPTIEDLLHGDLELNPRQTQMLKGMLEGSMKSINATSWGRKTRVSVDTALRDIQDLIQKNILKKQGGGCKTHYALLDSIHNERNAIFA